MTISKDRKAGRALLQAEGGDTLVSNDLEMISEGRQKLTSEWLVNIQNDSAI